MFRNSNESAGGLRRPARKSPTDWAHEFASIALAPLTTVLQRWNVSPNTITVLGFTLSAFAGVALAVGSWKLAIALIVIGGCFDGLDGVLARQTQTTSRFGAFLDSVLDRWSDSIMFLGLLVWQLNTKGAIIASRIIRFSICFII